MKSSQKKAGKPKLSKFELKQKSKQQSKNVLARRNAKFYDQVVDYFPRDGDGEGMVFNKAPVIKENIRSKDKSVDKGKRPREKTRVKGTGTIYQDYNSDEDDDEGLIKKVKGDDFADDDDFGEGLLGMTRGFADYFVNNKNSFKSLSKMSQFDYDEGSLVLTCIYDKGPNEKYMVVNLSRNKKGYVSFTDVGRGEENLISKFQIGEYVLALTMASNNKKVQFSLKPEHINREMRFENIQNNQIISGYLRDKEDYGYTIDFCTEDRTTGFLYTPEVEGLEFALDRPYLFIITGKNETTNLLNCQIIHPALSFNAEPLDYQEITRQNEESGLDLQRLTDAGNLVQGIVKKKLENGLLVSFLGIFYGFIFQDHLAKPLEEYKNNEKIRARIIATNFEAKKIHLSELDAHINLQIYRPDTPVGTKVSQATVKETLYGGSYFLEVNTSTQKPGKKATKMEESSTPAKAFLHKTHAILDEEGDEESKEEPKLAVEDPITKPVFVKEYNYFEHYLIVSMREDVQSLLKGSWSNIKGGDFLTGTISKITEGGRQLVKVIVNISQGVSGVVNYTHLSDLPSKASLKGLKEKKEVRVRVLNVDTQNKKLYLTMKPSLLSEDAQILTNFLDIQHGVGYQGVISGSTEKGFLVEFFNGIKGFLPYNDIENNGSSKDAFVFGQTVKVFVKFNDVSNQKIGLTLSGKSSRNIKATEEKWNNIENQNKKIATALKNSVAEGDVYKYKILRKKSATNETFLFAKSVEGVLLEKGNYVEHIAILPKTHCSDFESHNERLFEFYKLNDFTFQAKVLSFLPNDNVLISGKPSLLKQPLPASMEAVTEKHHYYGYVDSFTETGVRVKLSEHTKGFISSGKLPESIQANFSEHFTADKTLQVRVTKATPEQNKLYLELSQHKEGNLEDAHCFFLDYLDEEFLVASEEVKKNQQRWAQYKIGNYVEATIKLVKEYGIIVTLNDGMAGLILKSNLLKEGGEYKTGQKLICRVLDVDYDKSVVDLCEEKLEHTKFVNKYKKRMDYNREKVNKYALWKLKKETLSATVLLVKDLYIVGKLVKYPKVIVLIQCKNFNEFHIPHEVYEQHSTVKFRSLNLDIFHPKNASQVTEVDHLKKSSNAVIGEIFVSGKKEKEDKPTEKESAQSDMKLKQKLKEGAKVVGEITKIDRNNVFVALSKSIFGRVHKTQFDFDPISKTSSFSNFKVGDEITCKIISIRKTDRLYIDLTAQSAQLELPEEELNPSDFILQSIDETYKGKKYPAVVKNVSAQNMSPLYLELSNNIYAHVSLFEGVIDPSSGQAVSQLDTLRTVQENYKPGDVIEVWVKKVKKSAATGEGEKDKYFVEVTLYDCSSKGTSESKSQVALEGTQKKAVHKIGDQVLCKVVQILPKRVRVQFGKNEFGFVDLTELFDEFYAYPLKKIEEKRNLVLPGRIIGFSTNEGGHKSRRPEIFISLRESVLNPENWLAISPEGTTIQFKKKLGYQEEQGDLRNRIYKFGPSGLKENMIVVGYVSQTNEKGCFVRLGLNVVARSSLKELVEGELANPTVTYFSNRLVICRVLAVREDGKVDITLKEKGVKYGYNLDDNKLKVGLIVKGEVVDHLKNAALVAVPGCKYNGLLRAEEVNTEGQSIQKAYPVGAPILAKIKHIEKTDKSVQFKLTCRIEESELEDTTNIFNLVDEKSKDFDRVSLIYDSIQETCKEYNNLGTSSAINKDLLSNINAQNEAGREGRSMEVEEAQEEEVAGNAGFEEEVAEEEEYANEPRSSAMIDFGDEDEQEENEGDENEDDIREEQSVMSEEEDIEENIDFLLSNKSANKKRREIQKMKLEAEIREREKKLLDDNEKELKSSDDYEKLLLRNPNSSYIWIQYAAFKYQKDGIEKARQILERALRTITFRNEDEKLNLWTAYINLEYNFGTEDTLMKLFERAKATNNPKQVFIKLLDLYKRDQKWDLVEELSKVMIKKHKNSSKAWVRHLEDNIDIMKNKNVPNIDVSGIVSRALQSLPKRKHLKILSHHGMLLFKAGEQEKGRTVFEAIVTNYPKRTDIWSIYADMETKHGDKESFRNLMERCLTMSLNPKKMKFFFKRYLQYETKIGNADRIEYVRQKAREYVEKQMNEEENGNADENEEADEKLE